MSRRRLLLALALASSSLGAHADLLIDASLNFDDVAGGATANATLELFAAVMRFANPDVEPDTDAGGYTGTFHWIDATATYGDVRVAASPAAVSGANVLSNGLQPIMLAFAAPVNIASFSIQQDLSGYGNPQAGGSYLAFLDASGHEMSAANVYYTQGGQPGLTIASTGRVDNVWAILLAAGTDYDNLRLTTVAAAVPEPAAALLWAAGLLGLVLAGRRGRA